MNFELEKIRKLFREFYGYLPIKELATNSELVLEIEKIEKQLRGMIENEPVA